MIHSPDDLIIKLGELQKTKPQSDSKERIIKSEAKWKRLSNDLESLREQKRNLNAKVSEEAKSSVAELGELKGRQETMIATRTKELQEARKDAKVAELELTRLERLSGNTTQDKASIQLNSTIGKIFATAGPLLAGVLITLIDVYTYLVAAGLMGISTIAYLFLPKLTRLKPVGRSLDMVLGGVAYVRSNSIVLGAIALDLFIVLMGSVVTLLPVYAADILNVGPESLGVLRGMPALGGVVVGLGLAAMPPMRRSGLCLFAALLVFAASILVFAVSTIFWVSLVALFVYGAADMVSVNIRMTLIQLATPDHLRGRVSAVNAIFISSSNEMGDVRAGSAAALLGPVTTVFVGGLAALSVAIGGWYVFPKLRHLDRLADLCPKDELKIKGNKNDQQ